MEKGPMFQEPLDGPPLLTFSERSAIVVMT
jgi:hypothetical protein